MLEVSTIGLDIAKHVFQAHGADTSGRVVFRKKITRSKLIEFMAAHNRNKEGDYTYHHCAELQIRANPTKPIDIRFPAEKR